MTDSGWLHYRDLKSRCPVCKRPAHIAKRNGNFYFVDDEYNPFVRHAPVKTTEEHALDTIGSIWTNERRHPKGYPSFLNRICRIYGVYDSPACWYAGLLYL